MQNSPQPLISVAMAVRYQRNSTLPLKRSIESILSQTYGNFEFLICEMDSTPEARELLRLFSLKDGRIKLIDGDGTENQSQRLNKCIAASKGEFIARQDDDDFSEPDRFEKQIKYLLANNEAAFAGCSVKIVQNGKITGVRRLPEKPVVKDFMFTQPFIHPALIFRREALLNAGGYCGKARCEGCEDYDLLLRMYNSGYAGVNLPETHFRYTIPPKGTTNRSFRMRINEMKTRFVLFREMKLLPKALPYVIKPVAVGLIPTRVLEIIKSPKHKPE